MTTSWRDGRAFCALVHRYRPDLLDLAELDPREARANCALAFRLAEAELGIPALLDVEDMVDTVSPDRFSVLTYLAQFYHRLSGYDSGIASLSASPDSSAADGLYGGGGGVIRRSNSFGRPRGAILSLMDGRRVRSRSLSAHSGRVRGRLKSESFCVGGSSDLGRSLSPPPPTPIHGENPFKEPEPAVVAVRVTEKETKQPPMNSAAAVVTAKRTVTLREKKRPAPPPPSISRSQNDASAVPPLANQRRMAKSMILESDFDFCHSMATAESGGDRSYVVAAGPRKAGSVLSFTSVPSPYRGSAAAVNFSDSSISSSGGGGSSSRLSLLSLAYSSSRTAAVLSSTPSIIAQPVAVPLPPPAKPMRTFRHEAGGITTKTTSSGSAAGQNTWEHYLRQD
jgi:hypothetical protein